MDHNNIKDYKGQTDNWAYDHDNVFGLINSFKVGKEGVSVDFGVEGTEDYGGSWLAEFQKLIFYHIN